MNPVQIDIMSGQLGAMKGYGSVAQRLLAGGFKMEGLRDLTVLRKEEWIKFDEIVIQVARQRLVGYDDLNANGCRLPVANALGITRVEWETISDMTAAQIDMSGVTEGDRDRVNFALQSVPLPIIHKDFKINLRALESSRRMGMPLDTTQASLATKLVVEKVEDMLFNGSSLIAGAPTTTALSGASSIYGYTTALNRNTGSLVANGWGNAATTGQQILTDLLNMIQAEYNDNMYGPYVLYVPNAWWAKLNDEFKAATIGSIIWRLSQIPGITAIKPSFNLAGTTTTGNALLIQMDSTVVDFIDGMQPMVVMWETEGGFVVNFKVVAIIVPRMKSDQSTQSGICHYSI